MNDVSDITIVGGGDVGLLTALSVRQLNPGIDITVVDDFEEEPLEIGKSTFQAIKPVLHQFLEIEPREFFQVVKPVFKASVYFKDWCDRDPFHHPFDFAVTTPDEYDPNLAEIYGYQYDTVFNSQDFRTTNEELVSQGKTPFTISASNSLDAVGAYAYHLDTHRFNTFLRKLCQDRDISLVNDRITTVETDAEAVTRLRGRKQSYESELYVDASGFNRVLSDEFETDFRAFDIPLDSAFQARYDRPRSEIEPATVIESGEYGWFWQIDTLDERDIGYVYASEFVDDDDARAEFLEQTGVSEAETDVNKYTFRSGYQRRPWHENLVTIGNAQGFVEPLQSTGLTANAQAASALSIFLSAHDGVMSDAVRASYNDYVSESWESIYDFVYVHYRFSNGDTAFWDAVSSMEPTPTATEIIDQYNQSGLVTVSSPAKTAASAGGHDEDHWNLRLFPLESYYGIMRKMGATSDFYEAHDIAVSDAVKDKQREFYDSLADQADLAITHEQLYQIIEQA